ncbi:MAG TPA: hemerythrin domain-containing protein [Candidatus Nanoarchaeia archaeon]|nr:hemerythrin domain-containing protein [Candidatus Nanoarchaeia archaeon]
MKKPTEVLSEEHKEILKVIDALIRECASLRAGKPLDNVFFGRTIDFIRNFADKFHHAKEEDILFVELSKVEMHCSPMQQMVYEHDLGRGFVKGMEEGLRENNKPKVIENSMQYAQLLQQHIFKEDNILYPMADEALSDEMQISILQQFSKAGSKETEEKYRAIASELSRAI